MCKTVTVYSKQLITCTCTLYMWVREHVHYMREREYMRRSGCHCCCLYIRNGRKTQQANRRQKLGLVWRIRKKICQIIKDYFYLPFFLLIILWIKCWNSPTADCEVRAQLLCMEGRPALGNLHNNNNTFRFWARIFKLLRSPRTDSKESIRQPM